MDKKFNILATITIIVIASAIGYVSFVGVEKEKREGEKEQNTVVAPRPTPGEVTPVIYTNNDFGFTFALPDSWKGYTLVKTTWDGIAPGSPASTIYATGPIISIRHPSWSKEEQMQDIPVMIFTLSQWNGLQQDLFHIGAAPINPSELGRNANYVFALPARYNFAFPRDYEEVEKILEGKPLHAY